jgi:hypothetical protein
MKFTLKRTNREKGFTAVDLTVSLVVILLSISVISMMFYNTYLSGAGLKRNVIATDYAINILETVEATDYELVDFSDEEQILKQKIDDILGNSTSGTVINGIYSASISGYDIKVEIEKYADRFATNEKEDYIKIIKVTIEYKLGKNKDATTEKLEISTVKTIK